jgi:hypothetical protein
MPAERFPRGRMFIQKTSKELGKGFPIEYLPLRLTLGAAPALSLFVSRFVKYSLLISAIDTRASNIIPNGRYRVVGSESGPSQGDFTPSIIAVGAFRQRFALRAGRLLCTGAHHALGSCGGSRLVRPLSIAAKGAIPVAEAADQSTTLAGVGPGRRGISPCGDGRAAGQVGTYPWRCPGVSRVLGSPIALPSISFV